MSSSWVNLWGSNEPPRPRPEISFPTFEISDYNRGALKSSGPLVKGPTPQPDRFRSVATPFGASDAAMQYLPTIEASRFRHELASSGPKVTYPYGDGPMTEEKAIAILAGIEPGKGSSFKPIGEHKYEPSQVLETLKLLADGDLSDAQLEAYEEDAGRLRTYAALARQRTLNAEEQAIVSDIGRRLDAESASLAAEDVGYEQAKRNEINELGLARSALEEKHLNAYMEAAERKHGRSEAEEQRLRRDAEFLALEEEEANGWPSSYLDLDATLLAQVRLQQLRDEISAASAKKVRAMLVQKDPAAARARLRQEAPEIQDAEAAIELARTTKRRVNPRYARVSKADKQAQLLLDAIELSQIPDAAEDKTSEADYEKASAPGGAAQKFYDYNSTPYGRSNDPKFISNEGLKDEWRTYALKNPKLPKKAPWASAKNRKVGLKAMLDSTKVPAAFKMQILRSTSFV